MDITEKYLPIGTVVLLKGGEKRVMIVGFCAVAENDKEKVWDYSGCIYPEGLLTSTQALLFNHEQIEKIYHLGLIDEDEIRFKAGLNKLLATIEEEKTNEKE